MTSSTMKALTLLLFQFFILKVLSIKNNVQEIGKPKTKYSDKNSTDRLYKFIEEKIAQKRNYNKIDVKDKCMIQILREAIQQHGITYIFMMDGSRHEVLLHNLQANFVNLYYNDPKLLENSKHVSFNYIQIFHENFKVESVIRQLMPVQGTKFFVMVKSYEEALEKFEKFWKYRLVNAVVSFLVNKTVYYYTYFPYYPTHCGKVGKPHLLAQCDISKGIFLHKEKLFPQKVKNLYRCPINITFTEKVPSSYYSVSKKLTGWEIDLMNEIIQRMNGIPRYEILSPKRRVYTSSKGYSRLVKNSEIGGGLVVSLRSLVKTDFCMYGRTVCTTWIVPRQKTSHSVDFLYKVFPVKVWILLLFSFLLTASTYKLFYKVSLGNVLFKLLPFMFGTSTKTKKTSRILGSFWVWFCLTMNAIYQSGYQSRLLVPTVPEPLTKTRDIFQSKLKILGEPDIVTDAIPYFKGRYNVTDRRLHLLNRKISYEDWIYRMIVKKDSAFLGFKEIVHYHMDRTEYASKVYIPESCVINYMMAFVLKKNSHLTENFTRFSNRLNENGFVVYFMKKHLSRESRWKNLKKIFKSPQSDNTDSPPSIKMDKMYVIFMCHSIGMTLAFIAFIFEIMSKWEWTRIKRIILNECQSAWSFSE